MRLVGVNTPEIGEEGYEEAKEFVNASCLDEAVKPDVDDKEQYDPYYRILAVVYVNDTNLNEKLVREGYAEIMYIPPSEFNPYEWKADYTPSPTPTLSPTPIPGFEFVLAIIGVLTAICLVKRGR
jgi:endonuclease YncB( thermonuclease family)